VSGVALPPGSSGETIKVVQLSDFHYSPRLPFGYFRSAVEKAIREEPDLVLLTGDFVTFPEDAARLPTLFAGLSGRLGIFATLGNHDYWAGSGPVIEALRQADIPLITNDCVRLPLWEGACLRLCGIDDPWGEPPWKPPQLYRGDLNLMISHSADNIYRLRQYPYSAVFSGHFHAGQVRIPGFGALVLPSRYGRRFDHGHFRFKNDTPASQTHLFVSAGVGSATPLLRIYCQPDIFVVNFQVSPQANLE
jgi:predicted MPP superfamily phosphohydrolase